MQLTPPSRFAARLPPNGFTTEQLEAGAKQYAGPDVVYGSRLDMVEKYDLDPEKWGSLPSMSWRMSLRVYNGIQVTGHPYVGFWKGVILPRIGHLMCRPALMAFPFVLFWLLCSGKTKGQYGWVFVAFVPTLFAWLNDAYQLHLAVATRVPYTEAGGLAASAGI